MTEPKAVYKARRSVREGAVLSTGTGAWKTPQKPVQAKSAAFKLKAQSPDEALVLNAVLRYLKLERRVAWAARMNSGAAKVPAAGGKERFLRFGFKGCPDVLGQLTDGRFLAIECKRPGGRRRPEQVAFVDLARAHGAVALFAESVEDVINAINNGMQKCLTTPP